MGRSLSITFAIAALIAARTAFASDPGIEFFETKIRPVLVEQCYKCHSNSSEKLKAELYLDSREGILKGGESDLPAVVPGKLDDSTLIRAIRHEDEGLAMPPKKKLAAEEIANFEAWVKMGAPMPATVAVATTAPTTNHLVGLTVEEGRKFWSFVKPVEPKIPGPATTQATNPATTQATALAHNEIDRFINAKLAEKNLAPSAPADKRTLIRRATYDLIGLPPSPQEVDAFVADTSPDAHAKLIDRLLASPHYGERWGRYWLDVARYADTKGYMFEEERRYAFSYTYRDWVIRAFNEDLPYDQFLIQQIAADRLELKDDKRPLAALGFLTLGRRFIGNPHDIIDDRIDVVTRGTMALTVACARCHDHKYDPIPTADYYSLYGVFASSKEPKELPLLGVDEPSPQRGEYEAELAKRKQAIDDFMKKRHGEIVSELRTSAEIAKYLVAAQKGIAPPETRFETIADGKALTPWVVTRWQGLLKDAAAKNDSVFAAWRRFCAAPMDQFEAKAPEITKTVVAAATDNPLITRAFASARPPKSIEQVAERYAAVIVSFNSETPHPDPAIEAVRLVLRGDESPTDVKLADADNILNTPDGINKRSLQQQVDALIATHPGSPPRAMAIVDRAEPVQSTVFVRGNPASPGKQVPRQFPAILSGDDRKPFTSGSGRLELARAIASKDNPLTARVMVNRVWQYHFGAGLVRTPSDFGTRGDKPTHPELLDWLALRFMNDDAWSIKKLHKRIMLSAAYQQSSVDANPDARMKDPENRLLWRMNPRRLDLESMRDSLLATSGQLDATMGGRSVDILAQPFISRRTVYAYIDRQNLPGMFRTFDFASPDSTSAQRFNTSVPQQALFMMNSPFVVEQARKLAAREPIKSHSDAKARIAEMYRTVLDRKPSDEEIALGLKFITAEESAEQEVIAKNKSSPWQYGYGEFDTSSQQLKTFQPLAHFTGSEWQGGPALPDAKIGWAMLTSSGGHPGDLQHSIIRRWTAPRDGTIGVAGTVTHTPVEGDGVRARVVSSREGQLAMWRVQRKSADTIINNINVKQGDTIDFVIDCGPANEVSFDQFGWTIKITKQAAAQPVAGDDTATVWDAVAEFSGPPAKPAQPLSAWEKYAQVLLQSNEFAFVE